VIVYVESNFVLELALLQAECDACDRILTLCRTGKARLAIPGFSLAEPFETAVRRHGERLQLHERLANELKQLLRTQTYQSQTQASQEITSLLVRSTADEMGRLTAAVRNAVSVAEVIPLTGEVIAAAMQYQIDGEFSPQDGLVFASILSHLQAVKPSQSCFLNKNRKDFSKPDKVAELKARGCRLIYAFQDGLQFIESQLG
jgi:predicted nucleic acid-binding protein